MIDREKVIKGLESLHKRLLDAAAQDRIAVLDANMVSDAMELLKAQEPRLLTAEELTGGDECWLEHKNGACGYADCYMCTGRNSVEVWRCMAQGPSYLSWIDFNKTWRCWSAKPTDEQREAVKWE